MPVEVLDLDGFSMISEFLEDFARAKLVVCNGTVLAPTKDKIRIARLSDDSDRFPIFKDARVFCLPQREIVFFSLAGAVVQEVFPDEH
jgi:hypothetical protein